MILNTFGRNRLTEGCCVTRDENDAVMSSRRLISNSRGLETTLFSIDSASKHSIGYKVSLYNKSLLSDDENNGYFLIL